MDHNLISTIEIAVGAACLIAVWFVWKTVKFLAIILLILGLAAVGHATFSFM